MLPCSIKRIFFCDMYFNFCGKKQDPGIFTQVWLACVQEADENERKAREKQARVEASMKEREKEVKESLESSLRERDKERDQHKKDEAVQTFKALLVDLVLTPFKHLMHEE